MSLTPNQQASLEQLHSITNGDLSIEQSILESVGWDVQRAVDVIFDVGPQPGPSSAPARPPPSSRRIEQMEVDDSNVQHGPPATSGSTPPFLSLIGRLIAFPLVTTFNVLGYVFRLLRIPVPRLNLNFNWSIFSSLFTPPKRENPGVAAERWVRELEAEVGGRRLPEFYLGSYEDALSVARRELRIMCVVLVSEEHDDVPVFKRETLANPEFVSTIADNNILLWGGDVSSLEPFSASLKLGATTYPFIAFIAVQPSRLPSSSSNNSSTRITLAILSRFSGPTQTTSQHLTTHITDTLIPRVNSFLERLKAEERSRHHDRLERAESERRAEASAAADSARIAKKREEERMRKREEEERTRQLIQKQTLEMRRRRFWYGCRESLPAEPKAGSAGVVRITLRTPAGQRVLRNFTKGDSQDDLFRWCSSTLVPTDAPPQISSDEPYDPRMEGWGFRLATSYPRVALSWQDWPTTISTIAEGALKDGGMIVMELDSGNSGPTSPIAGRVSLGDSGRNLVTSSSAQQSHEDDDEYLSEED